MQKSHPPCIRWCSVCELGRPLMCDAVARKSLAHQNRMYRCTYAIVTYFVWHALAARIGVYIQRCYSIAISKLSRAHRLTMFFFWNCNKHALLDLRLNDKPYTQQWFLFCRLSTTQRHDDSYVHRYTADGSLRFYFWYGMAGNNVVMIVFTHFSQRWR